VFPIVILSLITIVAILMFLFEEAAGQAGLHLVIRTEAGRETGTYHGQAGSSIISVEKSIKGIHIILKGKSSIIFEGAGILPRPYQMPITGYQHLIDERKYARYVDFFNREENEDEDDTEKSIQ